MQLSLELLMYQLRELSPVLVGDYTAHQKYQGIKQYYYGADLDSQFIYMIKISQLAEMMEDESAKKVLFIAANDRHWAVEKIKETGLNFVFISDVYELGFLVNRLYEIQDTLKTFDKDMHIASLKKVSLQEMINIAEPYLEFPTILFDAGFNVKAYTKHTPCDYTEYQMTIKRGYSDHQVLHKAKRMRLFNRVEHGSFPFVDQAMEEQGRWNIYYKLKSGKHTYAYFAIFLKQKHLPKGYFEILQLILDNLSLYFKRSLSEQQYGDFAYENLLLRLLQAPDIPAEQLENQLKFIKELPLRSNFCLAVITLNEEEHIPCQLVARECTGVLKNTKSIVYQDSILLLKQKEGLCCEEPFFEPKEEAALTQVMKPYDYIMGISREFYYLPDLSSAYIQCCYAVKIGSIMDENRFFYYSHYYVYHMFHSLENQLPIKTIQSEWYRLIKQYDEKQKVNYMEIVMEFIKCGSNATEAARNLYMHRNTVLNAVKKIEEILHVDLKSFSVQQDLIISDDIEKFLIKMKK